MITMIFMILPGCGHAYYHENHNNLGNHGQKTTDFEMINRFLAKSIIINIWKNLPPKGERWWMGVRTFGALWFPLRGLGGLSMG